MCNYCTNVIDFSSGDKRSVKRLWRTLKDCVLAGKAAVTDVLAAHGLAVDEYPCHVDGRDFVKDMDITLSKQHGKYHFRIFTETAHLPNMEVWFNLIRRRYKGKIRILYSSREPGCEIFETNDEFCEVFPARYDLEFDLGNGFSGQEQYGSWQELVVCIGSLFGVSVGSARNTDEIVGMIKAKYQDLVSINSGYVNIHEFKVDSCPWAA